MLRFSPTIKRKRFTKKIHTIESPLLVNRIVKEKDISARFTGFFVEILQSDYIKIIHNNGCYGKLLKSCTNLQVESSSNSQLVALILDLEESFFLCHSLKCIKIVDLSGGLLSCEDLFSRFVAIKPSFGHTLAAYQYLKANNWVVKSGIKFGGDFLIYKSGPNINHASFIVFVSHSDSALHSKDIQGYQRIAETSDKDVLFLNILPPNDALTSEDCLAQFGDYKISEIIAKRYDYKRAVQKTGLLRKKIVRFQLKIL